MKASEGEESKSLKQGEPAMLVKPGHIAKYYPQTKVISHILHEYLSFILSTFTSLEYIFNDK